MTAREQLFKELTQAPDTFVDELLLLCLERRQKLDRSAIDQALIEMLVDPDYQADVARMEVEFATAQWEALELVRE